ncbi:MAG TPA: DUF6597 domain-containing transcriptional factor [Polyangiaceae bacterium]|nr:DUF6597 domain-containing transcriptional factor [Polyangiaceae bacterium]
MSALQESGWGGQVAAFWHVRGTSEQHRVLPDGCMDFVFNLTTGDARLIGAMTRFELVELSEGVDYFGVRLAPAVATTLIAAGAHELTDADAPLAELLPGSAELVDGILAAGSAQERRRRSIEFLLKAPRMRPADPRVSRATLSLERSVGALCIETLSADLGLSTRHLERLFTTYVGVGPKLFARVVRLQATVGQLRERDSTLGERSQARLAATMGYADESHLLREFRTLAGCTPSALSRERG